jgi:outer membrane protein assembly factor BamB
LPFIHEVQMSVRCRLHCGLVFAWLVSFVPSSSAGDGMDWPYVRGPRHDGISHETGLVDRWSPPSESKPEGENLLWSSTEFAGKSTPVVKDGRLYTIVRDQPETNREGEKIVCLDAATGKLLWENRWNVFLSDVPDTRIGWSSVCIDPDSDKNLVYVLGVNGYFQCLEGDTGKVVWAHSLNEKFGLLTTYGGRTNFPLVYDDVVIVSGVMIGWGEFARPNHRWLAFEKTTGRTLWFNATRPLPDDTTYSAPILGSFGGEILMVVGSGDGGLYAMQPRTGKIAWKYQLSRRGVNGTPLIVGDTIYAIQAEENPDDTTMGAVISLKGNMKGEIQNDQLLWRVKEVVAGRNQPMLIDDRLYVTDDGGGLFIFQAETGKLIKKQKLGTVMRGSPLYADGKLYICEANGRCYIMKPDKKKGVEILHKITLAGEIQASPIVSHGRIYISTTEALYCIGKRDVKPALAPHDGAWLAEGPAGDSKVTHIQVVPCESLVRPGEKIDFEVWGFNALGMRVGKVDAELSIDANGTLTKDGKFTASDKAGHKAAAITAKLGELTSQGLVRIVPDLPWSFDFSNNEIPITWIGARYRHIVREIDGNKVMVKVTTIPKGTRSQAWMGHTDFHDYTIQADVQGTRRGDKMPDIGLINQRYTLDMMGQNQLLGQGSRDATGSEGSASQEDIKKQQLQLRTWPPVLSRMGKTIPFTWEPNVWYTMKMEVRNVGGKAVVRGKVWLRDQPEPREWTIEAEDVAPNTTGSPGLYGNATNAEIFIDNIKVYANP